MEDVQKLFYEDMQEKRASASGARHKKGKQGRVGRMVTPSDLSGPEYRQASETLSYNLNDLVGLLGQSPALKEVLLSRLDEEYRHYRLAIERTVQAVNDLVGASVHRVAGEIAELRQQVASLQAAVGQGARQPGRRAMGAIRVVEGGAIPPAAGGNTAETVATCRPVKRRPEAGRTRRIRWGNTPEEIKSTSFQVLQRLEQDGGRITVGVIRSQAPSMMRWLYGEKAVFSGLKGLLEEYQQHLSRAAGS